MCACECVRCLVPDVCKTVNLLEVSIIFVVLSLHLGSECDFVVNGIVVVVGTVVHHVCMNLQDTEYMQIAQLLYRSS